MTFDPFHFRIDNAKTKGMKGRNKTPKEFRLINKKQFLYFINLMTIGGGAAFYTEWQILFPMNEDMPYYDSDQQIIIVSISAIMLAIAFFSQKEDD